LHHRKRKSPKKADADADAPLQMKQSLHYAPGLQRHVSAVKSWLAV
jgi:hypothetical protein